VSVLGAALRHPAALAVGLLLGGVAGLVAPASVETLDAIGKALIAVINMAATPLIVVAIFFGLRRLLVLPQAALRLAALVGAGLAAMPLCALVAACVSLLWGSGKSLSAPSTAALGKLSLEAEAATGITLFAPENAEQPLSTWAGLIPDNFYRALAFGSLSTILIGALLFGFALAMQRHESARSFHSLMEATYRGLEVLIERLTLLLPLVAFALAATVIGSTDPGWMRLMGGFLGPFLALCALFIWLFALGAGRHLEVSPWRVLHGLRRPFVVGLFSGGTAAAVPGLIDALCNQLGFRRDLVEFAAPVVPVFLRLGDAVFLAVLAVFVANIYGRPPQALDLAVIALAATAAALASAAITGARALAAAALLLGWLELPAEALLPVFVLLELLCEGPRNVVGLAMTSALVALASRGLASEAPTPVALAPAEASDARVRFVVGRRQAFAVALLCAIALGSAMLAGIGLGLRQAAAAVDPNTAGAP
jgi:aerobic C4-dicarboxylate transport protein